MRNRVTGLAVFSEKTARQEPRPPKLVFFNGLLGIPCSKEELLRVFGPPKRWSGYRGFTP